LAVCYVRYMEGGGQLVLTLYNAVRFAQCSSYVLTPQDC